MSKRAIISPLVTILKILLKIILKLKERRGMNQSLMTEFKEDL